MNLMMKLNVFAIIILYISTEASSESAMDKADRLKCRLMGTMKYLEHYGSNETAYLQKKVNQLRRKSLRFLQQRVNVELEAILKKINGDEKNGTDAENCYKSAETNVTAILQSLKTADCDEVDLSDATFLRANISLMNNDGHKIIDGINEGIISCASWSGPDFQTCVTSKFPQWRNSTIMFREHVENLKKKFAFMHSVQDHAFTTPCFGKYAGVSFRSLMNVRANADLCITEIENIH